MKIATSLIGILIVLVGITILIDPDIIMDWLEGQIGKTWIYITAIIVRLLMGILFIMAAGKSRYPIVLKVIGYLAVIAAVVFVLIGQEKFHDFMATLITEFRPFTPVSGLIGIIMGAFIIYAFSEKQASISE